VAFWRMSENAADDEAWKVFLKYHQDCAGKTRSLRNRSDIGSAVWEAIHPCHASLQVCFFFQDLMCSL
jgi:hypothetical protein